MKSLDVQRIASVLLLLAVCYVVMRILVQLMDKTMGRLKVEKSLRAFIRSVVRVLLWFLTIIIVGGYIGVPMSSLVALLGVIGLAVSLSIQGTLSNLAGGVMVLVSKPFASGDYIETESVSGVVSEVGMVYTRFKTYDNKTISVPNGKLSQEKITNYTSQADRRVDLKFTVSYDAAPELVIQCLLAAAAAHPLAHAEPAHFARATAFLSSGVEYTLRVWCATGDYWDLYYDLMDEIKRAFDRTGVELTYSHLNVHLIERGHKDE